jgi:hypothetical protein
MPVTYTNRKGVTYTLCRTTTKTGKARYVFVREPTDRETRDFRAERWGFRGRIDDWIFVDSGDLVGLAERLIPTLGTDAFFELY